MTMPDIFCLICDASLDISSCTNLFCTYLPRSGELLSNFVSLVLRVTVTDLHSSYICSQCCNLFEMLEQAQWMVLTVRCKIFKMYRSTERRKNVKETVSCDAEVNLNTNIVFEETKLNESVRRKEFREGESLNPIQMEEMIKQRLAQNSVIRQNLSTLNVDSNTDEEEFSDISAANIHTIKMPVQEENCIGVRRVSKKNKSTNLINPGSECSKNKIQLESITRSIDFTWKEIEERVTQVKKNSECNSKLNSLPQNGTEISETQISIIPGKLSKYETKSANYTCPTCDKKCKTSANLKTHVKTHSALRPYMCEKCGQAYKHKHALEVHVGMHNGINPFQCSFCNKCFTQKAALMRHLPIHTGEMAYQCELCGKRFKHHTSYNMHKLSHSGKKSYKCHICDLSLFSTSHLKRHMRVHTGEKPYSCSLCGRRFAERYNLLAHQKRELHDQCENKGKTTKALNYKCDHCNLTFENNESLNAHTKSHSTIGNDNNVKESCQGFHDKPKNDQSSKKIEFEDSRLRQTWIQMNRSKLDTFNNQTKFVFLQNPLSEIRDNSIAITFGEQKMSLSSTNYSTSLQVIIEPSGTTSLSGNHLPGG